MAYTGGLNPPAVKRIEGSTPSTRTKSSIMIESDKASNVTKLMKDLEINAIEQALNHERFPC